MPSQVEPRAHRNREPLMRIEGDRIGLFDTLQQMAQIRNKRSRAAPGGVSMQPEPLMSGHLCDALNRVNHTGVSSACGCNNQVWCEPRRPVSRDLLGQGLDIHL